MGLYIELLFAVSLLFISFTFIKKNSRPRPTHRLPPGPKGWPILGCLRLLGKMPHATLADMAKKFGPVMYLKMGTSDMVVISDPHSAMTVLKTLEHNFSDRPPNAGAVHIAYGAQDFVFADYGPKWKLFRKLTNLHMLGSKAFKDWDPLRADEIGHMVHDMYQISQSGEPVEVPSMVWCTMANLISQKSLNRRLFTTCGSESNDFKYMVMELMRLAGLFEIGDFIPSLAWMDLQGIIGKMKRFHKKFDVLLTKMIDEHSSTANERSNNPDFMDHVMANKEVSGGLKLTATNIKALLMNLFIAGTDTSAGTIEWGLAEMMNNPSILKKAQDEMDRIVGKNRKLEESDVPNLPYLRAVCKETFRLHPTTPLSLPRLCTNACELNGYYIPKNTTLLVNIWAIGRNPNVWPDPLVFNPDRFLNKDTETIEPWGNDFELIPFGGGKRMCAGIRMGIAAVEFILGTLVHSFEWNVPEGNTLDLEEKFGLVLEKAVPLSTMVVPRLNTSTYKQP